MSKFSRAKRYRLFILLAIVFFVIAGLVLATRPAGNKPIPASSLEKVTKRDVVARVSSEGIIDGNDVRDIYYPSGSKVKEQRIKVGQQILADDVITVLETVNSLGRTVRTEIKSPIRGMVAEVNYKVNDNVLVSSQPAVRIVDNYQVTIKVDINENDIVGVGPGQEVEITVPAVSLDDVIMGKVESVSPRANAGTGVVTYEVVISPNSLPGATRLGMSADVEIITKRSGSVLAVPSSYLIEKEDKYYVKSVKFLDSDQSNYEVTDVEVTIGLETDEYTEIKSGVKEGDQLLQPSFTVERRFGFLAN